MKIRSMTQKISYRLFFTCIFGFILAALLFTSTFYAAFKAQVWADLSTQANGISVVCEYCTDKSDLAIFANEDFSITLVDTDGTVLYESHPSDTANNYITEQEEIQEAFQTGIGIAQRETQSLAAYTYYYAVQLSDGTVLRIGQDAQSVWKIFHNALPVILLSCGGFLVVAFGVAYFLTRRITAPIMEMTRDLEHIQNNVPYRELSPFVSAIYSDRLLRENNEKIRQEFTANVSHELKSPLTSISGYAELITSGLAKTEDIPSFATKIHAEAQRMIILVEDILRLSQLDTMSERADGAPQFEQINLYELGLECIERQSINAKRAYVTLAIEGQDAFINGNRQLLSELFQNLCDNAIRYNKPGGRVTIVVGHSGASIPYMKVRDTGIGIPKESQGRIFERFYRVDKSHSKETGGTGLGLAIVKHIVLVHDGKLTLESELGKGTEISVRF